MDESLKSFQLETCAGLLKCESCGDPSDPLVLLLHGSHQNSGAQDWRTHLHILSDHDIYAVSVSLPGCGVGTCRSSGQLLPYRSDLVLMPGGAVDIMLDVIAQLRNAHEVEYPITFVGEGYGASVCLALAQWEPHLVGALVLFQCCLAHGRFPFQQLELRALSMPVLVIWAEAESSDGRYHPQLEQSHVLAKIIPSATICVVSKQPLDSVDSESSSSSVGTISTSATTTTANSPPINIYAAWPSKQVYDVAHGVLAYEERAVVVVGCEESCEKAPTKEEALEFEHKALELRRLIDIDIHHDRMRHTVGEEIANFINGYLEDSTVSPHTSSEQPVFRHGFGLYEGVAAEVDPQGHGVIRTVGLQVGEGVLAAKRQQVGSHEAMKQLAVFRAQATAVSSSTGHKSSHKEKPQVRQPDFTWAFPEPVSESIARGVVELGVPPIRDSLLTPGRIVGVGAGGRQHTFAVEYEDGDIESAVHRLRIASAQDHKAENGISRPPFSFTEKMISTRLFHGNIRKQIFVRSLGKATSYPLLLLHGSDNCSSGRDLLCFAEPLVHLGYRVIIPDMPGYGLSPGIRERIHPDEHLNEGGPIHVLEDVLRDFGWFPSGQAGNSHTNAPLDILGVSTGVSVALSFALKHGHIANISHGVGGDQQVKSRIGTIISINGVHRSGYKDQAILVEATGKGGTPPVTATTELAGLSKHIKTLVLAVSPDLTHPRSLSVDLASKIKGAVLEELNLHKMPKSKLNPKASIPLPTIRTLSSSGESQIGELRKLSLHCFETHSDVIVPRITNWLLQWGTSSSLPSPVANMEPPRLLSPLRKGLTRYTGPGCH